METEGKKASLNSYAPLETKTLSPAARQAADDYNRERERVFSTKTQLEQVNSEIASRNAEHQRILKSMSGYQSRVEKLPIREQQMAALTRDYETSKANYRSLLDKKISAGMASEMERSNQSERFTVADPARVPQMP